MYKNIDKLVEVNQRKLDRYDDLQSETGNVNSAIDKDLDYMTRTNAKLRDQIQIHSDVERIAEDKHRRLCLLNDEIREIQELLVNELSFVSSVSSHRVSTRQQARRDYTRIEYGKTVTRVIGQFRRFF